MSSAGLQGSFLNGDVVNALQGLSGNVSLSSPANSITIVKSGQTIQLEAVSNVPLEGVDSLNGVKNDVFLTSDGSITITPDGQNIELVANFPEPPPSVASLNELTGPISLLDGGNCSITPNVSNGTITLTVPPFVASLNGLQDIVSLSSEDATFTPNVGTGVIDMAINFPEPPASVASLNQLQGVVSLTSPSNTISIGTLGQDILIGLAQEVVVESLNGIKGQLNLTSNGSITITPDGQTKTISLQSTTLTQYGTTTVNIDGVTSTQITIDFPVAYSDTNTYSICVQTYDTQQIEPIWTNVFDKEAQAVKVFVSCRDTSPRSITVDWMTIGSAPV